MFLHIIARTMNLKSLVHGHHSRRNECFIKAFSLYDYRKDNYEGFTPQLPHFLDVNHRPTF